MRLRLPLLVLVLAQFGLFAQEKKDQDHWVAAWGTAQLLVRPPAQQTTSASAAQTAPGASGFDNQTIRMIARVSTGGRRLHVKLSNAFNSAPVTIGAAHIALRAKDSEIVAGSDRPLLFNGNTGCTIGPGIVLTSDPVDLDVPALSDVAVSLYLPGETGPPTNHGTALHTTYIADGNATGQAAMPEAKTTQSYYWLAAIDIAAPAGASAIVTLGDSITDGTRSEPETNHSWPALLAARLAGKKETAKIGVANVGISGNRVLRDVAGASALARFDRDVLSQSGVEWVMLLEGINDVGHGATEPVSADDLIGGYRQLIGEAHAHGIRIIGCTLTPYEGAGYATEKGEAIREEVNQWIRTGGAFDAVVDFEAATRDPNNPKRLRPDFDPGDHLHPNNAGYEAMANAIDLSIFGGKRSASATAKRR